MLSWDVGGLPPPFPRIKAGLDDLGPLLSEPLNGVWTATGAAWGERGLLACGVPRSALPELPWPLTLQAPQSQRSGHTKPPSPLPVTLSLFASRPQVAPLSQAPTESHPSQQPPAQALRLGSLAPPGRAPGGGHGGHLCVRAAKQQMYLGREGGRENRAPHMSLHT